MIWPPQSDGGRVRRVKPSGEPGRETLRRSPCFATVSQYEICADGKKLVGSAQRIWPDAMLQHGSILLGPAHCRIEAYLRGTALGSGTLAMRTTSISEVLGERIEPHVLARSLRDAASHVWKIPMEKKALTRRELEAVRNLVDTKYGIDAWNLRKASPEMKTDASGAHGH